MKVIQIRLNAVEEQMLKEIQKLKANDYLRKAFLKQPKTTPHARDWVNDKIQSLRDVLTGH